MTSAPYSPEALIKAQLEAICENLWWSSESDYPIEVVWYSALDVAEGDAHRPAFSEQASSGQAMPLLHKIINVEEDQPLVVVEVEAFFAQALTPQSWHTAEDKAQLDQLRRLKALLTDSLQQLQVYRYGEIDVLIYILGYTPKGDIAGVKTCSVET